MGTRLRFQIVELELELVNVAKTLQRASDRSRKRFSDNKLVISLNWPGAFPVFSGDSSRPLLFQDSGSQIG